MYITSCVRFVYLKYAGVDIVCVCVCFVLNRRYFLLNTRHVGHVLELKDKIFLNLYLINFLIERE